MNNKFPKKITDILLYASIAIFLFGSGYKYAEWQITKGSREQKDFTVFNVENPGVKDKDGENLDFSLFWDTWETVEAKYIDEAKLDKEKMYYGAIKGMVASLGDPYTFFLTPEENKQSKDDLGGKFEGIGAQLGLKGNRVVVIAPLKNSPAEAAGVRAGDYVIKVDGESTKDWTLSQTVSKIRGKGGTQVAITFERAGQERPVTITRSQIKVESVELSFEPNGASKVAYLKLNQFGDTSNEEWDKAVASIKNEYDNNRVTGMVLDLRDNPGGYLESAVYIASEFLDEGKVVVKQETTDMNDRTYTVQRAGQLKEIPLVVMINGGSASASEILGGALRDHKRATLVGEKSFGKGSVQEPIDLKGGAGLHVTIAKWILPNGEWINGKGIEPSVVAKNEIDEQNTLTKETDTQFKTAIQTLNN